MYKTFNSIFQKLLQTTLFSEQNYRWKEKRYRDFTKIDSKIIIKIVSGNRKTTALFILPFRQSRAYSRPGPQASPAAPAARFFSATQRCKLAPSRLGQIHHHGPTLESGPRSMRAQWLPAPRPQPGPGLGKRPGAFARLGRFWTVHL
jgi:hypothetical protein